MTIVPPTMSAAGSASDLGPKGCFVGHKISKIRWRPLDSRSGVIAGSVFIIGSWDDPKNVVSLMAWPDTDGSSADAAAAEPRTLATFPHGFGDVNEIQFAGPDMAAVASSDGRVTLLRLFCGQLGGDEGMGNNDHLDSWGLDVHSEFLHMHRLSCNAVACSRHLLASAGADGRIVVFDLEAGRHVRTYDKADSCSLNSVLFVQQDEVASANMRGQLKLWDLRSKDDDCASILTLSNKQVSITCLTKHPTQHHILCTGSEDGMLAFWDLRKETHPITILSAHQQAVSEVQFHQQQPDHMFSCSQNGDIWHWNGSNIVAKPSSSILNFGSQLRGGQLDDQHQFQATSGCPWLNGEAVKHRAQKRSMMTQQPLPVNSLDVLGNSLLTGEDNEALYLIPNVLYP